MADGRHRTATYLGPMLEQEAELDLAHVLKSDRERGKDLVRNVVDGERFDDVLERAWSMSRS